MQTLFTKNIKKPIAARSTRLAVVIITPLFFLYGCHSVDDSAKKPASEINSFTMVSVAPGELNYYPAGEYLRNGFPSTPNMETINFEQELVISARQVSQYEYAQCVQQKACKELDKQNRQNNDPNTPAVGVSWQDATDYAQWLSQKTGHNYRLPTYSEWVHAAGSSYIEDVLTQEFDDSEPAQRWLAEYALETQRNTTIESGPRQFGEFGVNEHGLMDISGNVWDWTDNCHVRQHLDNSGFAVTSGKNCGVRVVAGAHRSYIPDFIRDAKSGACSVGVPPSNLGFRLVRVMG